MVLSFVRVYYYKNSVSKMVGVIFEKELNG